MKIVKVISLVCFAATLLYLWSCEDNSPDTFGQEPYDSSKPVRIDGFEPDSGGLATKVFISGSNFGTDLSQIRVWFTATDEAGEQISRRASVVGSNGSYMYVITPRLTSLRECTISVVSHGDSAVLTDKEFIYNTMYTVTTVVGKKGTAQFQGGTLAEATLDRPQCITVDDDGNIFVTMYSAPPAPGSLTGLYLVSPGLDLVQQLISYSGGMGVPAVASDGKTIIAPSNAGALYWTLSPDDNWEPVERAILPPTVDMLQEDPNLAFATAWKSSFATCPRTGFIYTYEYLSGHLIKFNPMNRRGQRVDVLFTNTFPRLCFDTHPDRQNILYISYRERNAIYTYDVDTGEHTLFAGMEGASGAGYKDGHRLNDAQFREPDVVIMNTDHSIFFADMGNHCIRRIDLNDGMVTTVIGRGGISGYLDGNREDALFNRPQGMTINKDGVIYVADTENNCVRRLAVE